LTKKVVDLINRGTRLVLCREFRWVPAGYFGLEIEYLRTITQPDGAATALVDAARTVMVELGQPLYLASLDAEYFESSRQPTSD